MGFFFPVLETQVKEKEEKKKLNFLFLKLTKITTLFRQMITVQQLNIVIRQN